MTGDKPRLILGSSSPFRRTLLERLGLEFRSEPPAIDESPLPEELPGPLVRRLARSKADAVARSHPDALIIASDQVAVREDGVILGKPGDREQALRQLTSMSGSTVTLETGLCLLNAPSHRYQLASEGYRVHFRTLTQPAIERYLERERPFNCAGSFRSEALGITLFRAMEGRDPNTVIGLPLILLTELLNAEGVALP